MRLYLTHRPDSGATEVRVEVGEDKDGRRLFSTAGWPHGPRSMRPVSFERPVVHAVDPGSKPPLYCPPIPDAEMARLLGIEP